MFCIANIVAYELVKKLGKDPMKTIVYTFILIFVEADYHTSTKNCLAFGQCKIPDWNPVINRAKLNMFVNCLCFITKGARNVNAKKL